MPLIARLIDLVTDMLGQPAGAASSDDDAPAGDERPLAIAALLVHVARVDGTFVPRERERVQDLLRRRFAMTEDAATRLIGHADRLDREIDDVATLIEMLGHHVPLDERRDLVAMAYAVAGADGRIEEFEDDLVWRMAGLLGFDQDTTDRIKAEALARLAGLPAEEAHP